MTALENFEQYCSDRNYAEMTVRNYRTMLKLFEKKMDISMEKFVGIAKRNQEKAGELYLQYIRANKESCSTYHFRNVRNSLDAMCHANKTSIDWKLVPLPKGTTKSRRKPYSKQEIQELLENVDLGTETLIKLFALSGMREGALNYLKLKHVKIITKLKLEFPVLATLQRDYEIIACKLIVYADEPEEYFTFAPPELAYALKRYLLERMGKGENVNDESSVLVNNYLRPRTTHNAYLVMYRLLEKKKKKSRSISPVHSFRKFYETTVAMNTDPLVAERLTGHSVGLGTAEAYVMPNEEVLLEKFLKSVPALTLSKVQEIQFAHEQERKEWEKRFDDIDRRIRLLTSESHARALAIEQSTSQSQSRSSDSVP